jgi:hypothetical protein
MLKESRENPDFKNELTMQLVNDVVEWLRINKRVDPSDLTIQDRREIKGVIEVHKPSDFGSKDFLEQGMEYWAKQYALIWIQTYLAYKTHDDTDIDDLGADEINLLVSGKHRLEEKLKQNDN